jgi:hypothetical protein
MTAGIKKVLCGKKFVGEPYMAWRPLRSTGTTKKYLNILTAPVPALYSRF